MDDSQITKYVYADSTNRDTALYPSGNAYTLFLTNSVKSIVRVDLVAAKVPNTSYNVTDGNNFININITSVSISPGYYSGCGLATALVSASGNIINVDFLPNEGKFLFSSSIENFTISATIEAQRTLGIAQNTPPAQSASSYPVYANDPAYAGMYLTKSRTIVDLSTHEYIFLDIQELRSTSVIDAKKLALGMMSSNVFYQTTDGSSIRNSFGMVPMDVPGGSIKNFKEESDFRQYIEYDYPVVKLDRLTVRWVDKNGDLVVFNGYENNAFTLRLTCVYDKPEPPLPPLPAFDLKRYLEAIPPPPPPPPKKTAWGRWFLLLIIGVLGFLLLKKSRPEQVDGRILV
jgi:hypothetical protein